MKFFVIAVAFAMFVSVQGLTEAQREQNRANAEKCIAKTNIDEVYLNKIRANNLDFSNDKANKYAFCVLRKMNLISSDGTIDKNAGLALVSDDVKDEVEKAIDLCCHEGGANKEEKAFKFLKCYYKNKPDDDIKW